MFDSRSEAHIFELLAAENLDVVRENGFKRTISRKISPFQII